jgi:hypothetical protein
MWHVLEHLYYEKTRAGPLMEYVVCEARMTGSAGKLKSSAIGWQWKG